MRHLPCLLLPLPVFSLVLAGRFGAYYLWGLGGSCTWWLLYGYEGADYSAEQLTLTDQHFDAALSELAVVARGQPCKYSQFLTVDRMYTT